MTVWYCDDKPAGFDELKAACNRVDLDWDLRHVGTVDAARALVRSCEIKDGDAVSLDGQMPDGGHTTPEAGERIAALLICAGARVHYNWHSSSALPELLEGLKGVGRNRATGDIIRWLSGLGPVHPTVPADVRAKADRHHLCRRLDASMGILWCLLAGHPAPDCSSLDSGWLGPAKGALGAASQVSDEELSAWDEGLKGDERAAILALMAAACDGTENSVSGKSVAKATSALSRRFLWPCRQVFLEPAAERD